MANRNSAKKLSICAGGYSTAGAKETNQDAFAVKINKGISLDLKGHIAVIADGVSSANCAAKASQMSVCHFVEEYLATPQSWSVSKSAAKVLNALNNWLYSQMSSKILDDQEQQWFSTFSAIIFKQQTAHILHIGDCQIAKLNAEGYQILTKQHSTPSGILNRALGATSHIKVDLSISEIELDDMFMLSCDGVYDYVNKSEITNTLLNIRKSSNIDTELLESASENITKRARQNGSMDNLTCLIIKIENTADIHSNQLIHKRNHQVIPPALSANAKLDHFLILETIQQTARSHIYLALDTIENKNVILKIPSLNFVGDFDYLSAFIKEGCIGENIKHNNLMKIFPHNSKSCFMYHVCEPLQGVTLDKWSIKNLKPNLVVIESILEQMVSALRYLQRMDIVHCDLKPDNFMIDKDNKVTLIDYGSCLLGSVEHSNDHPLGTLTYSAPEVLLGQRTTHQSDLFSIAVIVYQLLCQKSPYKKISTFTDVPKSYSKWQYRPISTYRLGLPNKIDKALSDALSANPKHRTTSYSELVTGFKNNQHDGQTKPIPLPLIESNPTLFWQSISIILLLLLVANVTL